MSNYQVAGLRPRAGSIAAGGIGRIVKPLTPLEVEDLTLYLLLVPEVFMVAEGVLLEKHFSMDAESHLALVWSVAVSQRKQYGHLTYLDFRRALATVIEDDNGMTYTPTQVDVLLYVDMNRSDTGLVDLAFNHITVDQLNPAQGLELLRRMLYERAVVKPARDLLQTAGPNTPLDFSEMLTLLGDKHIAISQLGRVDEDLPLPDTDEGDFRRTFPIPVHVFSQHFMSAGQAEGEAYGLMAPTGVGKTTCLVHIAVACGRMFISDHATGKPLKHVKYYTWEETSQAIGWRMQSCAACIQKQNLEDRELRANLSSVAMNNLKDYEYLLGSQGHLVRGERERLEEARWMNRNIRTIDMTKPGRGLDLLASVDADCASHSKKFPNEPIGVICIDHAMAIADAYIGAGSASYDNMRHILRSVADQSKRLAEKYRCSVWLAHQASTATLGKVATSRMGPGMAAECRGFEQPLAYCFVLGYPDPHSGISLLWNTKDRRTGNSLKSACVRLDGALQRLDDKSQDFVVDNTTGRIVTQRDSQQFAAASAGSLRLMSARRDGVT